MTATATGVSASDAAREEAGSTKLQVGEKKIWVNQTPVEVEGMHALDVELVSERSVSLNAEYAEKHLDLPRFRGERDIAEGHVQYLHDQMATGNFNPRLVILARAEWDGVIYGINGQHTCWAVIAMPGDFSIQVREQRYRVKSAEQLRKLYSTFDRSMARTDSHISLVHLVDMPEVSGVAPSVIKLLVPGFRMWKIEDDRERRRYAPEQIATLIRNEHSEVFRRVAKFWAENANHKHLKRQPVYAAMFAIFDRDKKNVDAETFWKTVADGVNVEAKTDPRYQLREFLNSIAIKANEGKKRIVDSEEVFRICVSAWNKWRAGDTVRGPFRAPLERQKVR